MNEVRFIDSKRNGADVNVGSEQDNRIEVREDNLQAWFCLKSAAEEQGSSVIGGM